MANIVIWGRARDLLGGVLPPSVSVTEVDSLAALQKQLEGAGATLVLADPARLASHEAEAEAWLRSGGSIQAVLVAVVEDQKAEETLSRYPFLDDVLLRPVTAARIRLRLERAFETIHSRRVIRQLEVAVTRKGEELHTLNNIGVALSAERDNTRLLNLILAKSREITVADAGSLYLVERRKDDDRTSEDRLRFKLAQNDSVPVAFEESVVPLDETSIAGYAALTGKPVNVADAYLLPENSPYTISRSFDEKSGYRTKSMLVVPMKDHLGSVIGVVQLINKKKDALTLLRPVTVVEENVIPFTTVDEELVTSLASQAAVAYENTRLIDDIKNLFDIFVKAAVTTIEQRDPTTSGHAGRVADRTVRLAELVDGCSVGPFRDTRFNADQIKEIRYASLLHDFGKVGVRDEVLIKPKKLYDIEMKLLRQRIDYVKRAEQVKHLQAKLDQVLSGQASPELLKGIDEAYERKMEEMEQILQRVLQANEPTVLEEERFRALMDLGSRTYLDMEGNALPLVTADELAALSIPKGSLSDRERKQINDHVTHTYEFLSKVRWTGEFRRLPEIAYAHHEKLDGSGYPRGLKADQIPVESRMMTISDIYDALVAWDRPYKGPVPVGKALDILSDEAKHGKLDRHLLSIFIEAKVYDPKEETRPGAGAKVELLR
jgi:HD-GYP domain-containing protein (c-di-GMP phosphodiesterase class II)